MTPADTADKLRALAAEIETLPPDIRFDIGAASDASGERVSLILGVHAPVTVRACSVFNSARLVINTRLVASVEERNRQRNLF